MTGMYGYGIVFIFGAVIGSFLNVVLYRLHTGRSLDGRSHCMSCGKVLAWYELVPIVSYLIQRGRCRGCGAYVPARYLVVEVLTGFLFVLVWHVFAYDMILLALHLMLAALFVLIAVYDVRHTIIPDELTIGVGIIAVLFVGYEFVEMWDFMRILARVGAGLGAAFFFWGLWYMSKGRWIGFGDAKLALPLGVLAGVSGVFSMVVFSFWIGAVVSVALLGMVRLLKKGKTRLRFSARPITIKSEVPFAPFLIAGFVLVHFFHADTFNVIYVFLAGW